MFRVRQWLTDADGIKTYTLVRSEFVKHECASMLAVIPALVWLGIKVEIEVVAVRTSAARPKLRTQQRHLRAS